MSKAPKKDQFLDDLEDRIAGIWAACVIFIILYVTSLWFTNRAKFYEWIAWIIAGAIALSFLFWGARRLAEKAAEKHLASLLAEVRNAGLEDYVKNFISRFGFEGNRTKGWSYRNHKIDWYRIDDFEKYLIEKGVRLRTGKKRDVFIILRHFVQEKEENLTRGSLGVAPQKFSLLSGTDFEKLLYRLFEAMGYQVELTGRTGDQGGDLIANKNGERILIQAKCYRNWNTGNEAVQQAVGAMRHYDCNKTMVVTTSSFTNAARALAKSNSTELISKDQLTEMLMRYLGESWV